jgi:hypothetical protein
MVTTQLHFQIPIASANSKPKLLRLRGRENDELRDLRSANRNMAQHIQALSLLVREQEQQIAKLQREPSESARVVPLVGLARR